ncbi:AraC family transcriptional regulator [Novosphingobium sp. FSW06-99]|uniref:helix-turn-helix domain-containing protein n=1 Tax=Novosphingobium sp. FSW06-99 TaxID=1739113 RepID=UPI000A696D2A|nr:helix-turn-helix domain-containing protein [Novosphingobium sp. FSW06-99]
MASIDLSPLDGALRLIAVGEMLMVALVVARSGASAAIRRGTVLLLACVIAYLAHTVGGPLAAATPVGFVAVIGATATPLALWLFAHVLFERAPDRRIATGATAILLASVITPAIGGWCLVIGPWLDRLGHLVMALLAIDAVLVAVNSRSDDLSEKRRRFALAFVAIVAAEALVIVLAEAWFGYAQEPVTLRITQALLIMAAGLVVGGALLEADADLIGGAVPDQPPAIDDAALAPAEHVLRDRLIAAMAAGAWLQQSLTIGDLAAQLGVPEHRLRALINQRLGYRNFSAFLNRHRIAEAKARLADPNHVALPVLTIAMDLGYGSLAPFNRAFREATGQTPTDFRRAAFADNRIS